MTFAAACPNPSTRTRPGGLLCRQRQVCSDSDPAAPLERCGANGRRGPGQGGPGAFRRHGLQPPGIRVGAQPSESCETRAQQAAAAAVPHRHLIPAAAGRHSRLPAGPGARAAARRVSVTGRRVPARLGHGAACPRTARSRVAEAGDAPEGVVAALDAGVHPRPQVLQPRDPAGRRRRRRRRRRRGPPRTLGHVRCAMRGAAHSSDRRARHTQARRIDGGVVGSWISILIDSVS